MNSYILEKEKQTEKYIIKVYKKQEESIDSSINSAILEITDFLSPVDIIYSLEIINGVSKIEIIDKLTNKLLISNEKI